MREVILQQPEQIRKSLDANKDVRVEGEFDAIILAGMGGSGHPGDLLNALHLPTVPLAVHRDYDLPRTHAKNPLVIISSYSGNTEEALSAYHAARTDGRTCLINTSGGTLAELAAQDGTTLVTIPFPGMQPRHTLLANFSGLFAALRNSGLVEDVTADLTRAADTLRTALPSLESPAQELATTLKGKTPVFTAAEPLAFAAKNFKIQTNENAKTPAFWNTFPELNHNEMVGFSLSGVEGFTPQAIFHVLMLRDDDDHPRIRARMDVTADLYRQWGVSVSDFRVEGTTLLDKLLYAVSFGLWTAYYLATTYGIDPIPVKGVEDFKKRLAAIQ